MKKQFLKVASLIALGFTLSSTHNASCLKDAKNYYNHLSRPAKIALQLGVVSAIGGGIYYGLNRNDAHLYKELVKRLPELPECPEFFKTKAVAIQKKLDKIHAFFNVNARFDELSSQFNNYKNLTTQEIEALKNEIKDLPTKVAVGLVVDTPSAIVPETAQ
jgi:hypothetical protein